MFMQSSTVTSDLICYHCGQACEATLWEDGKSFCCQGCVTVYGILHTHDLCAYYALDQTPGVRQAAGIEGGAAERYGYLDSAAVRKKVVAFDSDEFTRVQLFIPAMHCISCIWLLEHLPRITPGVLRTEVNFARKSVCVDFNPQRVLLSEVVYSMDRLGYTPQVSKDGDVGQVSQSDRSLVIKLAVAGFCFGNVMLFSFPEYLGVDTSDPGWRIMFAWLNLALSIPVFFYSASGYFTSAYQGLRRLQISIDVPIAAGLAALFLRSTWDIVTASGAGYLDSFTGLVFFLLIGRWFQSRTFESLRFDRDFTSYFPLAIQRQAGAGWESVVIYALRRDDVIRVRNMEIVPADSALLADEAYIDYSFVTGEARPVLVHRGDRVYAGGRLVGQPVMLRVEEETSQSHLTSLWNNEAFRKQEESSYQKIIDRAARRFTWVVMVIAALTGIYWYVYHPAEVWLVLTSVLMVACPCALALAAPFTYGNMLRVFGRYGLYLKNADVIERMAAIDTIVFDKTGTVTHGDAPVVVFRGALSAEEYGWIKCLTGSSTHPLSVLIASSIQVAEATGVTSFREFAGKGIEGVFNGHLVRVGAAAFAGGIPSAGSGGSEVFVSVDHTIRGFFSAQTTVRSGLDAMLNRLGRRFSTALLSGDNASGRAQMQLLFGASAELLFDQSPHDKLAMIRSLQQSGRRVMMVGDGLNDSGALKQSDAGLAVTDSTGVFTPASDGILTGDRVQSLDHFIALARSARRILLGAFTLSFFYNAIALSFAVTGHLTPLVAAILMPVSSFSVVAFSTLGVRYAAARLPLTPDTKRV